jgi:ABC-type hemin transport system substrate-binding protein
MAASRSPAIEGSSSRRGFRAAFSFLPTNILLFCLLLAVTLAGCRSEEPAPHEISDDLGRRLSLPPHVERIITLAPNVTEIVFAIGAGEKIVGTDDNSNHPAAARRLPSVGGMQPNVEKIAALRPDLVIASTEGNHPNLAAAIDAAGIPLYVVRTDRLEEVSAAMRRLGTVLDAPDTAEAVRDLEQAIETERRVRPRAPRVLFAVWHDPLYVAGRETFTDDLLTLTGAENAVKVSGWPQYSLEALATEPPDLIIFPEGSVSSAQIRTLLRRVPGVDPRLVAVDEDVFQRPGPRLAEAARALNAILDAWEQ